jgi:hypothetical protein
MPEVSTFRPDVFQTGALDLRHPIGGRKRSGTCEKIGFTSIGIINFH